MKRFIYFLFFMILFFPGTPVFSGDIQSLTFFPRISTKPGLSLHKSIYLLFGSYANDYSGKQTEVMFQISAKQKLYKDLYFAYTQRSFWQAYDVDNSSPFRETNFNPEIFYRFKPGIFQHENLGADVGFEHESNGQNAPESRSYNRIYVAPYYINGSTLLYSKCWYRIPEKDKISPDDNEGDDNPDLLHYIGYGELHLYQAFGSKHIIHAMGRGNIQHGRGAFSLDYSFRIPSIRVALIMSFFTGYGESLIDYNNSVTRIGAGLSFGI